MNIFGTVLAFYNSQPFQLIVKNWLCIKLQLFETKLATTKSEEVVEFLVGGEGSLGVAKGLLPRCQDASPLTLHTAAVFIRHQLVH